MNTVCMLGEGAWGTAVATVLAHNGYEVRLWCHDASAVQAIVQTRVNNTYLPGVELSERIVPTSDLSEALQDVSYIFQSTPVSFLRTVVQAAAPHVSEDATWILLSKGIENDTLLFPCQIVTSVLAGVTPAYVAGPSFAQELAAQRLTAFTVAASHCQTAFLVQRMLANEYCRPYTSDDLMGAQIGAALKNVIALGVGIADGAAMTDNTKAFLFTRGLHEMRQLISLLGGKQETLYGLSGVGDAVMSSMGKSSRNFAFGQQIGAGNTKEQLQRVYRVFPEGVNTLASLQQLIEQKKLDLPVCTGIYRVVFGMTTFSQVLDLLMHRPLELECTELLHL